MPTPLRVRTTSVGHRPIGTMLVALMLGLGFACGNDGQDPEQGGSTTDTTGTTTVLSPDGTTLGTTTMSATTSTTMSTTASGTTTVELDTTATTGECVAIAVTNEIGLTPVDILLVVDNSGSMTLEALFVQENMNTFSNQITRADIDTRVVLISGSDTGFGEAGICVPEPLGSGDCPNDTNLPTYLHIDDEVGSSNALDKILEHSETWLAQFRPRGSKHLIAISDDDSTLLATDFDPLVRALDPSLEDYTFHAIVAPNHPDPLDCMMPGVQCCDGAIPISSGVGQEYLDLIDLTGGIFGDLCVQDFSPFFDQLSMQMVADASLACEYTIPPPPDGEMLDQGQVNVELDGMGDPFGLGYVESAADCAGVSNGWHYDDADTPTTIVLCPQTCTELQGFTDATVSVEFGCATVPAR